MRKIAFDSELLRARYESGASSTQIARELGVSTTSVIRALEAAGIPRRDKHDSNSLRARGNRDLSSHGYVRVNVGNRQRQYEHILIAERALGRKLKRKERVHHIDCDRANNRNDNLLICTHDYHLALHARMRADPYWSQFDK